MVDDRDGSGFAPDFQLGYVTGLGGAWQAGLKFTYKYANLDSSDDTISIPQSGAFTTTVGRGRTIPFSGFVPVGSSQITLKHQFALMPTIGRTFGDVTLYAGGGPALFDIKSKIIDAVGFALIDAHTVDVTGAP